ncbi:MAG: selenocysteine-specific translation elongation factor [Tissierellia bacterium]|nr:selenocysteine-specific translation elongation factor [Tissierellia bacterium]
MKHIILGTAGHIDHGKTTLTKALTGKDTDTLREEKERGISINLGFSYFDLPSGERIGVVDMPGHEKFIKNMAAGSSGIDLVLMIVAADEGVMPQTLEHADILDFLGVKRGIIVLTKIDSVDDDMLELVKYQVRDDLDYDFLKNAPIVCVDSVSKKGIDNLLKVIEEVSKSIEYEIEDLPPRLNIDRVFTVKGHGSVVTGTLSSGEIKNNSTLYLYPGEREIKIRNVQVHDENQDSAFKGQRSALNISGLKTDEIERGDIISDKFAIMSSDIINARVIMSKHTSFILKHWTRVRILHGTKEVLARVVPLEGKIVSKDKSSLVQFRLEEKLYFRRNDPFVIRSYSPIETVAGGKIIYSDDLNHTANDTEFIKKLKAYEENDLEKLILNYLKFSDDNFVKFEELLLFTAYGKNTLNNALKNLKIDHKIYSFNEDYIEKNRLENINNNLKIILKNFHKENPLLEGMHKDELLQALDVNLEMREFNLLCEFWQNEKIAKFNSNIASLYDFTLEENPELENKKAEILEKIKAAEPELLKISEFTNKDERSILMLLSKTDITLLDEFVISNEYLEKIKEIVKSIVKKEGSITIGQLRDNLGISRKPCLFILEHLDKVRFTKRLGDKRILV